jgi:hypothetical protein
MIRIHTTNINPKTAFFILSTLFCILISQIIPLVSQILLAESTETAIVFTNQLFIWGLFGLVAGIGFAVFGIIRFTESTMVKLIRFLLILLLSLTFLMYIAVKVAADRT